MNYDKSQAENQVITLFSGGLTKGQLKQLIADNKAIIDGMTQEQLFELHDRIEHDKKVSSTDILAMFCHAKPALLAMLGDAKVQQTYIDRMQKLYPANGAATNGHNGNGHTNGNHAAGANGAAPAVKLPKGHHYIEDQAQGFLDVLHTVPDDVQAFQYIQKFDNRHDPASKVFFTPESDWSEVGTRIAIKDAWVNTNTHLYYGVNPSAVRRSSKQAAFNEHIHWTNCFFGDFDAKNEVTLTEEEIQAAYDLITKPFDEDYTEEDKRLEAEGTAQMVKFAANLDYYKAIVMAKIDALQVKPSVIIDSGGGYHCFWLFTETWCIGPDKGSINEAAAYMRLWVYFVGADKGVCDARRILRLPGYDNNKPEYPVKPQCGFVECDLDLRYDRQELLALLPEPEQEPESTYTLKTDKADGKHKDFIDRFNRDNDIRDVLRMIGRKVTGNQADRPKKPGSRAIVINTETNRCKPYSTNDDLHKYYDGKHTFSSFDLIMYDKYQGDFMATLKALMIKAEEWEEPEDWTFVDPKTNLPAVVGKPVPIIKKTKTAAEEVINPIPRTPAVNGSAHHAQEDALPVEDVPEMGEAPEINDDHQPADDTVTAESMGFRSNSQSVKTEPAAPSVSIEELVAQINIIVETILDGQIYNIDTLPTSTKKAIKIALKGWINDNTTDMCAHDDCSTIEVELEKFGVPAQWIKEKITARVAAAKKARGFAKAFNSALVQAANTNDNPDRYVVMGNAFYMKKVINTPLGPIESNTRMTNFEARIVADVHRDDGIDSIRNYAIVGTTENGKPLREVIVPAKDFKKLEWVAPAWGSDAHIEADAGAEQHTASAIHLMGMEAGIIKRTIYTHTGWRMIDGKHVFLHAGGAVGMDGVTVELEGKLDNYRLPTDNNVSALDGMIASLSQLEVGDHAVTFNGVTSVYLAPLIPFLEPAFLGWDEGLSGAFKTSYTMLNLNHFGAEWGPHKTPAGWISTPASLERTAFAAKDIPLVIDDMKPAASKVEEADNKSKFNRISRVVGNLEERTRLTANATAGRSYPPRGLVIVTAEHGFDGESANARTFITKYRRGMIDKEKLTEAQEKRELYGYAMRSYIQMIADRWNELSKTLPERKKSMHKKFAGPGIHERLPEAAACMYVTFELMIEHAINLGAIASDHAETYLAEYKLILVDSVDAQNRAIRDADPCKTFIETIITLLAQEKALLHGRKVASLGGSGTVCWDIERKKVHRALGEIIGDHDGEEIRLYDSAYGAVQKYMRDSNGTFSTPAKRLREELEEKGYFSGKFDKEDRTRVASIDAAILGDQAPEPGVKKIKSLRVIPIKMTAFKKIADDMGIGFDTLYANMVDESKEPKQSKLDLGTGGRGSRDD